MRAVSRAPGALLRGGLLLLLAAASLVTACGEAASVTPAPPTPGTPDGALPVTLVTADGVHLDGHLFRGSAERLVILLHMYPADQRAWYAFARALSQGDGDSALTFDFRGYGASEGAKSPDGLAADVRAAIAYGQAQGFRSIMLVGASMGGTAAIVAAADEPDAVVAVITLSAPVQFGSVDARAALPRLRTPLAAVASREDDAAADSLHRLRQEANLPPRRALLYDGGAHGTAMLTGAQGAQVAADLRALIQELWTQP